MDQESFLSRVRASLEKGGRAAPAASVVPSPPASAPLVELVDQLARESEAVGSIVYRVGSSEEARQTIVQLLVEREARRVIRGATSLIEDLDLDGELEQAGMDVTVASLVDETSRGPLRDAAFTADAGVTSIDYGVAESGTLAVLARSGQGRAVSLLPPVHIAVLDTRHIVAELAALFERVTADGGLPSALTFITGPSRTGDIELKLTVGVHGPKELHLILLDSGSPL